MEAGKEYRTMDYCWIYRISDKGRCTLQRIEEEQNEGNTMVFARREIKSTC
jgi:hypothetical protein